MPPGERSAQSLPGFFKGGCPHLDLRLLVSRSLRQEASVFLTPSLWSAWTATLGCVFHCPQPAGVRTQEGASREIWRSPSASSAGYGKRAGCHRLILGALMQASGAGRGGGGQVQKGCWEWGDRVPNPCDRLQQQACYPRAWRADLSCPRTHS